MNAVYSSEVMYEHEMGQIQNEINAIAPGLNNLDTVRDKGAKVVAVIRTHKVANNTIS